MKYVYSQKQKLDPDKEELLKLMLMLKLTNANGAEMG